MMMEIVSGVVAVAMPPGFSRDGGDGDESHDRREYRGKGAGLGQAVQQTRFRHTTRPIQKLALALRETAVGRRHKNATVAKGRRTRLPAG
jgi:hypothetical protein